MTALSADAAAAMVTRLSLEEKVELLSGRDAWSTHPNASIGLASMVLSDGPSGVRGDRWDERFPSLNLPSATALSSSWDVDIAARYGAVAAGEARRKGVHVILGPTVNLHRSPLGGRHFEAFSEDPVLTADLASAYVSGAQRHGVAATPKHYVANDFETERFTADVRVDDRALRELYLLAFERAVTEGHAWAVMSAYNAVNGATGSENPLLSEPLNGEWGFDGVVVSDWTAVRSIESARHPQDLAMPGPGTAWGPALVDAVRVGDVDAGAIDRKVARLLVLASRVGALEGFASSTPPPSEDAVAFARLAAVEGMVLVRNEGLLPLAADTLTRVVLVGENALQLRSQGGGSATVLPEHVVSPLDGLRAALPGAEVVHSWGATVQSAFAPLDPATMTNPVTGGPGAQVRYLDETGLELATEARFASLLVNDGGDAVVPGCTVVELSTTWTPTLTGPVRLGFAQPGRGTLQVAGELVLDDSVPPVGGDQIGAFFSPESRTVAVRVLADNPVPLTFTYEPLEAVDGVYGSFAVTFGAEVPERDDEAMIADAVEAARDADVVVLVVGTNAQVECEGFDRTDLRLPGRQDELVAAVAAVNPRTVVVVNAGAPVEMPWRDDVSAVLLGWFGGQEFGHALADVLLGIVEPGGRLPTTWPKTLADVPVSDVTPVDDVLAYTEGIHIGYRAWLRAEREPAYPFGFGLGYATWQLEPGPLTMGDREATVSCLLTNLGERPGKHVMQIYASRFDSAVDRPARWLAGFAATRLEPGASTTVTVSIPTRAFAHWAGGWTWEAGVFELLAGSSALDLDPVGQVRVDEKGHLR